MFINEELILENPTIPEYKLAYFSLESLENSNYQIDDIVIK